MLERAVHENLLSKVFCMGAASVQARKKQHLQICNRETQGNHSETENHTRDQSRPNV